MKVLFITKGSKKIGSSRARVWWMAEHLEREYKIQYNILCGYGYPFFSFSKKRISLIKNLYYEVFGGYDIIFIHKSLFSFDVVIALICAKLFSGKKIVYDLDDAEWIHSKFTSTLFARIADVVFCGSHVILSWAAQHNKQCVLIPTVVDSDSFKNYNPHENFHKIFTVLWDGNGIAHFKSDHFSIIRPPLRRLKNDGINIRFVILGACNYKPLIEYFSGESYQVLFGNDLDYEDPEAVPSAFKKYEADVGVMPLHDTLFNQAKCAFKAVEYMASSIPTVASLVGESEYLIRDGVNGFVVEKEDEWYNVLKKLASDPVLRRKVGEKGRKTVEEQYTYRAVVPRIKKELEKLF